MSRIFLLSRGYTAAELPESFWTERCLSASSSSWWRAWRLPERDSQFPAPRVLQSAPFTENSCCHRERTGYSDVSYALAQAVPGVNHSRVRAVTTDDRKLPPDWNLSPQRKDLGTGPSDLMLALTAGCFHCYAHRAICVLNHLRGNREPNTYAHVSMPPGHCCKYICRMRALGFLASHRSPP